MKLTKYGRREWLFLTIPTLVFAALSTGCMGCALGWRIALGVYLPIWCFVLWFFRDPERPTPTGEGLFISPADGMVADITPLGEQSRLGRKGVQVGVFMNVFSVHVNRSAFDGVITKVDYKAGSFIDVRKPESYELNESTSIFMDVEHNGETYPVVMRQISGLIARRIVTDLEVGQRVRRGERIGMIKFGSRVELLVPSELAQEIPVEIGDTAYAGVTVLAKFGGEATDE